MKFQKDSWGLYRRSDEHFGISGDFTGTLKCIVDVSGSIRRASQRFRMFMIVAPMTLREFLGILKHTLQSPLDST